MLAISSAFQRTLIYRIVSYRTRRLNYDNPNLFCKRLISILISFYGQLKVTARNWRRLYGIQLFRVLRQLAKK